MRNMQGNMGNMQNNMQGNMMGNMPGSYNLEPPKKERLRVIMTTEER